MGGLDFASLRNEAAARAEAPHPSQVVPQTPPPKENPKTAENPTDPKKQKKEAKKVELTTALEKGQDLANKSLAKKNLAP